MFNKIPYYTGESVPIAWIRVIVYICEGGEVFHSAKAFDNSDPEFEIESQLKRDRRDTAPYNYKFVTATYTNVKGETYRKQFVVNSEVLSTPIVEK